MNYEQGEVTNHHEAVLSDKELAIQWQTEYGAELELILEKDEPEFEEIVQAIFEKGILDHLAPVNPAVIEARTRLNRNIWSTNRQDPNLYLRTLYSLEQVKTDIKKVQTLAGANASAVMQGFASLMMSDKKNNILQRAGLKDSEALDVLVERLAQLTKEAIAENGGQVPEQIILPGTKAEFCGIPVTVVRYVDGWASLKTGDENSYMALGHKIKELTGEMGACLPPQYLYSKDFKTVE